MPSSEQKLKIFHATSELVDAKTPAAAEKALKDLAVFDAAERANIFYLAGEFLAQEIGKNLSKPDTPERKALTVMFNAAGNPLISALIEIEDAPRALLAEMHAQMIVIHAINREMGEQSHPLIKLYAEEAAKLTDAQYNSNSGQLGFVLALSERVYPAPASPSNPYRKKPAAPK